MTIHTADPTDVRALAKQGWEGRAIAARHHMANEWPTKYRAAIADAHRKVEARTHNMLTGRSGDFFVLYLDPKSKGIL